MDIRPIRNEDDYNWALAEIEVYFENEPALGTPESDRFDVLAILIEAYEDKHHSIEPSDPIEVIRFMLDQNGMKQSDLAEYIGSRGRVSEIMNRKRPLNLAMIRRLSIGLHIPIEALTDPYPLAVEAAE